MRVPSAIEVACGTPVTETRTAAPLLLRLVSFNVRYATATPVEGEEPWPVRCPRLCSQLRFITVGHDAAFLCLQEVLYSQVMDIREQMGPLEWAYIGQGRDDGKTAGEFSPIFYRPHVWRCERSRVYWLSETPDKPSRGWDAALNRIVTVALFCHRLTGRRVVVMSTHFDHLGKQARQESAKFILAIAEAWNNFVVLPRPAELTGSRAAAAAAQPLFLGGDFNSTPDDGAYKTMTAVPGGMLDMSGLVRADRRYGNAELTYTSFGEPGETPKRIDFLFVKNTTGIRVVTSAVLANQFDDGVFLSDHRAVVADVLLLVEKDG